MEQGMTVGAWQLIIFVIYVAVILFPFWKITAKAGYNGWLSLLMIFPLANLIYLYFLAFSDWPSLQAKQRGETR